MKNKGSEKEEDEGDFPLFQKIQVREEQRLGWGYLLYFIRVNKKPKGSTNI